MFTHAQRGWFLPVWAVFPSMFHQATGMSVFLVTRLTLEYHSFSSTFYTTTSCTQRELLPLRESTIIPWFNFILVHVNIVGTPTSGARILVVIVVTKLHVQFDVIFGRGGGLELALGG